jgi:hypothetical protein
MTQRGNEGVDTVTTIGRYVDRKNDKDNENENGNERKFRV